ncbi:hypothetical protein BX600DRAFT_388592 [Xylariales sp. PMI_506]|nr:hypothetical protein BX600DRAFT_388592 [Xylariales sp. PMI_506]
MASGFLGDDDHRRQHDSPRVDHEISRSSSPWVSGTSTPHSTDDNLLGLSRHQSVASTPWFASDESQFVDFEGASANSYLSFDPTSEILGSLPALNAVHEPVLPAPEVSHRLEQGAGRHDTVQRHAGIPKSGARFNLKVIQILKDWLSTHLDYPYASVDDLAHLQHETGLNKQQIFTWLANARRRLPSRTSTAPKLQNDWQRNSEVASIAIPSRSTNPTSFEDMNPLQRWQNSPPEHEAANVSAIAHAVSAAQSSIPSYCDSPQGQPSSDDTGSVKSREKAVSISSRGTSQSSRASSTSAYSHNSRSSPGPLSRNRSVRKSSRRRRMTKRQDGRFKVLPQPNYTFQCTFCTETYKTKHDWQRHEKSMHLSLDQWVCTLNETAVVTVDNTELCVYCGVDNPSEPHLESHHHKSCLSRPAEERTFYRKDHLHQHLKLVHQAKFLNRTMDHWHVTIDSFQSRCGFCTHLMSSWGERVDHIAEHFKNGSTMADWKGNWGFEPSILEMVENAVPAYIIHFERSTPVPFTAIDAPLEVCDNAYELIKSELTHNVLGTNCGRRGPYSDAVFQYESCCIIFGSESLSKFPTNSAKSWLRDLLMSSDEITEQARVQPLNGVSKSRLSHMRIKGKKSIFEQCSFELQLQQYVERQTAILDLGVSDEDLQQEASNIIRNAEMVSLHPSDMYAEFLIRLVMSSRGWLAPFRLRSISFLNQSSMYEYPQQPPQLLSASNSGVMSTSFSTLGTKGTDTSGYLRDVRMDIASSTGGPTMQAPGAGLHHAHRGDGSTGARINVSWLEPNYRRLTTELARFVAMTMSPNNPNRHVPTDEELQYQARWIDFDDDDPWNQTPAENFEWLQEFKRSVGLIND